MLSYYLWGTSSNSQPNVALPDTTGNNANQSRQRGRIPPQRHTPRFISFGNFLWHVDIRAADLLDRSIIIDLNDFNPGERKGEKQFWAEFNADYPAILGAILNGISAGLRGMDSVNVPTDPRMLDFIKFATAAETAWGFEQGTTLKIYTELQTQAANRIIYDDEIGSRIVELLKTQKELTGTAGELIKTLGLNAASPAKFAAFMRFHQPDLQKVGINVKRGTDQHNKQVVWTLKTRLTCYETQMSEIREGRPLVEARGKNAFFINHYDPRSHFPCVERTRFMKRRELRRELKEFGFNNEQITEVIEEARCRFIRQYLAFLAFNDPLPPNTKTDFWNQLNGVCSLSVRPARLLSMDNDIEIYDNWNCNIKPLLETW